MLLEFKTQPGLKYLAILPAILCIFSLTMVSKSARVLETKHVRMMEQMAKTTSAGVLVTNGSHLLLCHVTNARHWDIPKGKVDPGESMFDAAVRELYEETSIIVADACLVDLGLYKYKKDKDLSLWLWQRDTMPDPATCSCKSTFNVKGRQIHEMDGYANVSWEDVDQYVVPDLARVLHLAKYHINNVSH
jgi:8-oxo-dGTP pyrophosphatase MutT (NUDIX family)